MKPDKNQRRTEFGGEVGATIAVGALLKRDDADREQEDKNATKNGSSSSQGPKGVRMRVAFHS